MKIVVIGAGFGGLRITKKLAKNKDFEITLIDKFNFHQFQPLFYQVATGGLDASNISFPLRKIFQNYKNVKLRLDEVIKIDDKNKIVYTAQDQFAFDKLIIATGATTNFFNNEILANNALGMKSTEEALRIRHLLFENFENAVRAKTPEEQEKYLNIVIVGGGPTGVELSGAIADLKRFSLPKDYPEIDFNKMKIFLAEGSETTLEMMSAKSAARSMKYLKKIGVEILCSTKVTGYDGNFVTFNNRNPLPCKLVIWAAGIKANTIEGLQYTTSRGNRIVVDELNRVEGNNDIYAIGDVAAMVKPNMPYGHPQVAPVAIQQADNLAWNITAKYNGVAQEHLKPFKYFDKGSMATIGRNLAVVDIPFPKISIGGVIAWLIWMFLHLFLILGVKNKFFVFINWVYNYFTYDQSLRLIFKDYHKD